MHKFAVYIDTENFSDTVAIAAAIRLFNSVGEVSICEAHGHHRPANWTNQFLRDNNISGKFAPASSRGKNSIDMTIVAEAMETIGKGFFAVCVMSGDGDFNPLAEKIKKDAMEFWGVGETKKASLAFQKACSAFFFKEDLEKPVADQKLKAILSGKLPGQIPQSAALRAVQPSTKAAKGTTSVGYVNKNNQKNNGKTDLQGNDHGQAIYAMACLHCGQRYGANGSDIWQRKCPKCQKGQPCSTPDCNNGNCTACKGG